MTSAELRRRHLEQELAFLTRRLGERVASDADGHGDLVDRATRARELTDVAREQLIGRARALRAALERVADGSYGVCLGCDHPISEKRLAALPEATHCLPCQELREKERARLAPATRPITDEEDD